MKFANQSAIGKRKARKGFSLVELVVVILIIAILAVAVFAGGSAVIKKSQVSRTTSDLHNFSVAVESTMNENPRVANITGDAEMDTLAKALSTNLPSDYSLTKVTTALTGNTTIGADSSTDSYVIYKAAKTDAWDNPYYVIFDYAERHAAGNSDFYITVVSAGPNAKTAVDANIESDDIFLLCQYQNGDVSAVTYNAAKSDALKDSANTALTTTKGSTTGTGLYTGSSAAITLRPVNF